MSNKLLVGRYELIEKIGEGGMAVVYKAKDRLLNRFVAIKILRPEYTKDAQFVDSFRRESQAAAGLQHSNITSVYDVGHEGDIHFIVMELVDGKPLSDIIKEQAPMDYKVAIEITKQVASALSLAHRNNIIHRDIKPHNIMLTRDGIAKLGDFGIAKAVSDATLTETSRIMGSVHYFSPEQARGAYVDERSDIYSLGIVLYEMLTGKVPFDGDNPVQVALMHINDEIKSPSMIIPGIPPALEKIVMKATDKFQSNRFASADEMLDDLKNIEFVTRMVGNSVFVANDDTVSPGTPLKSVVTDIDDDQQEEKKPKKKNKNNKKKIIAIVAGVVIFTAVVVGALVGTGVIGGKKVEVPNVVDLSYSDAKRNLEDVGLKVERGDKVTSDTVEAGKVAKQDPKAYEKVEKGSTVTLNISAGKAQSSVPNLVGKTYDKDSISALLKEKGFELDTNIRYEKSDKFEKNQIISQSPIGDAVAEKGAKVSLVVCSGKKTIEATMPSLTGLTYEQAVKALHKNNLEVGEKLIEENDIYAKGTIFWQQYDAGKKLKRGTTVNIKISKGAPNVNPNPNPKEKEDGGGNKKDNE